MKPLPQISKVLFPKVIVFGNTDQWFIMQNMKMKSRAILKWFSPDGTVVNCIMLVG